MTRFLNALLLCSAPVMMLSCVPNTGTHAPSSGMMVKHLFGLRAYGGSNETHLPVVTLNRKSITGAVYPSKGDQFVTVEFDVDASIDPQLKLLVVHCTRDWREDWAHFDDNFMHLQTSDVHGELASPQMRAYSYHYAVRCPDPSRRLSLDYSGNYKMFIVEGGDTLAVARFYAVDPFAGITVRTFNEVDYGISWHPQVNNVEVLASFAPEVFPTSIEGVDLITDHRTLDVKHIDPADTNRNVHVDEAGPVMRFSQFNLIPGNAYRYIDCSDPAVFPPSSSPISLVPRDIVRSGIILNGDYHGSALLNGVDPTYADYLPIRFRLDAMGKRERDVFIVGPFNQWHPDIAYQMDYDAYEHSYVAVIWLKRGAYEYQYVTGIWNERSHSVVNQSWSELEGNGWGTTRMYTALVYYHDTQYGGIDRIVGCGSN